MLISTSVLWVIAVILAYLAYRKEGGMFQKGISFGWNVLKRNIVVLALAFLIVGFVDVLAPQSLIERFLGPDSGWSGLLLAEAIGMLLPGGPYAVFPIIGLLYAAGAGLGPVVTLIASYSLLAFLTVTFELPFMGWRFTAVRMGIGLLVPLLVGAAAMFLV